MIGALADRLRGRSLAQVARLTGKTVAHALRRQSPRARAIRHADRAFDRQWGTDTSDVVGVGALGFDADRAARAVHYQPSSPAMLEGPVRALGIDPAAWDFVDYGAGKGRMVMTAAQLGFRSATGIELSEQLCAIARRNLAVFAAACPAAAPARIVSADATAHQPEGERILAYFYNPFDQVILAAVRDRLEATGREVCVVYTNPVHAAVFDREGWQSEQVDADTVIARRRRIAA